MTRMKYTETKDTGAVICRGHIVDVVKRQIITGEITMNNGVIESITPRNDIPADAPYYLPGFIDSHVHIESSMLLPTEFARIAVSHGSIGAICDPHEIANVLGVEGVELMIDLARNAEFHFAFGAPSCVPSCSSDIETSGYQIDSTQIAQLMKRDEIKFLAEMMNFPGVLNGDKEVMAKIESAKSVGKPVDGHAPGLVGELRKQYADAGISTDHECTTIEEGRAAISSGMYVLIREGSAAKDYAALAPLLKESPRNVMFCTDDSHPTDLIRGHVDRLVRRAIEDGYDIMDILHAACVTPREHYHLDSGLLQVGDSADFIAVTDLTKSFRVLKTYVRGVKAFSSKGQYTSIRTLERSVDVLKEMITKRCNIFNAQPVTTADIAYTPSENEHIIVASDGSLFTGCEVGPVTDDVQKIVVYNRYTPGARPQVAYIKGFNIRNGAIAQSIAHDCHNILAIGSSDEYLVQVINRLIKMKGGIVATDGVYTDDLPLPVAGLMSPLNGFELAFRNKVLEETVHRAGCTLSSPFITLAFMALPVIPQLKLTDKGLFDSNTFQFIRQI